MTVSVLAKFPVDPIQKLSSAVVDNGLTGYLCFYEVKRRKELAGFAWIYNRGTAPSGDEFEPEFEPEDFVPMPKKLARTSARCPHADQSSWVLILAKDGRGALLLQDGCPVVFEDGRNEMTYCRHLAKAIHDLDWEPMSDRMVVELLGWIRPQIAIADDRALFAKGIDPSTDCWLEIPKLPPELIVYGKPKRMDKISLQDVLRHPIWIGMVEDRFHDEDYERPVTSQTDVDDVLIGTEPVFIAVTFRIDVHDLYGIGFYDAETDSLASLALWHKHRWTDIAKVPELKPPLTLVTIPSIRGRSNVKFVWRDAKKDHAIRSKD